MMEAGVAELDIIRKRLTNDQRAILNAIWECFRDQNEWILRHALDQRFGKATVRACLDRLGDSVMREIEDDGGEYYRLTFLGVLLTDQGEESEQLLARYLEYVRKRSKSDPSLEWVGSQEVEAALGLPPHRSRLLRQLIRLSHWWGGGSGFGDQEWTVGVPVDVDDLPPEPDLHGYIREHVLTHFPPGAPSDERGKPRGEFWFVSDPALQRQLRTDWHEAQDVYQVRGWKSCLILCRGILEGMLLDALARQGAAPVESEWSDLAGLVEMARGGGILSAGTPSLGFALQEFRHLIHPGRAPQRKVEVTRDGAEAALVAVRMCMRQIAAWTSARQGQQ
jgi:hypothetical protein